MPTATPQPAAGQTERSGLPPAIDVSVLDALIAEIGDGMPDLRDALLVDYLEDAPKQITTLARAVAEGAGATVAAAAHQLRSGSALLGATRLAELLTTVEVAAVQPDVDLRVLARPALAEFARVRDELAGMRTPNLVQPGAAE